MSTEIALSVVQADEAIAKARQILAQAAESGDSADDIKSVNALCRVFLTSRIESGAVYLSHLSSHQGNIEITSDSSGSINGCTVIHPLVARLNLLGSLTANNIVNVFDVQSVPILVELRGRGSTDFLTIEAVVEKLVDKGMLQNNQIRDTFSGSFYHDQIMDHVEKLLMSGEGRLSIGM